MFEYLVEAYYSPYEPDKTGADPVDVAGAADEVTSQGRPVRLIRAIFAPEDETCFFLFEAGSAEYVTEAAARSGLRFQRLVETASVSAFGPTSGHVGRNPR